MTNTKKINAVLINAGDEPRWLSALSHPGVNFSVSTPDSADHKRINCALIGRYKRGELANYPNLEIIQSLWAGVDRLLKDQTISSSIPIIRMVDPSLTKGMVDYVVCQVMNILLRTDQYDNPGWDHDQRICPRYRGDVTVGFLGFGVLGKACAMALSALGFNVRGWGRSRKDNVDVQYFHGLSQLYEFLKTTDVLINLLPNTESTLDVINYDLLTKLPKNAVFVNVGRGEQVVEQDLLDLLDSRHLAYCVLDVFREEPLPRDHLFWAHPKVRVSPHIASVTNPETAAKVIEKNLRTWTCGGQPGPIVNRVLGY